METNRDLSRLFNRQQKRPQMSLKRDQKVAKVEPTSSGLFDVCSIIKLRAELRNGLVRRSELKHLLGLLIIGLVVIMSLSGQICEAKTHHSKRQAPDLTNQSGGSSASGRENTNWWNLWWQQYISEAAQPTARPIVGVSFNGRSINLNDQTDASGSNNVVHYETGPQRDLDTNLVMNSVAADPELNPIDLERNEKLRLVATSLPNNMHPFAAKQMMLAQRKSNQQQANWQSVKPTLMSSANQAATRQSNRRAVMYQTGDDLSQSRDDTLGIQMRVSSARQQETSKMMQQPNSVIRSSNEQPQEQMANGVLKEDSRFEQQQQNQMVDYSEEGEPDMGDNGGANNMEAEQERGPEEAAGKMDSSSSGMMLQEPEMVDSRLKSTPSSSMTSASVASTQSPRGVAKTTGSMMDVSSPANEQQQTTRQDIEDNGVSKQEEGSQRKQPSKPSSSKTPQQQQQQQQQQQGAGLSPQQPTGRANQIPVSSTTATPTTSATAGSSRGGAESSEGRTSPASTSIGTTKSSPPSTKSSSTEGSTTKSASPPTEITETPISIDDTEQQRATTPTGRVELEGGRPATSTRQQGTTTSARLPTAPASKTTTTTTTTTTAMSKSSPKSGGQESATTARADVASSSSATPTTPASGPSRSDAGVSSDSAGSTEGPVSQQPTSSTTMSTESGESGTEDSSDEGDEEENSTEANGNRVSDSADSMDDSTTDADSETEQEPSTSPNPNSGSSSARPTTQLPALTTIDIERLPKSSAGAAESSSPASVSGSMFASSRGSTSTMAPTGDDITRIRPSANLVMMTLDQGRATTIDGDTAITMPMDTLMKLVMNQASGRVDTPSRPAQVSPKQPEATTTQRPMDATSVGTTKASENNDEQEGRSTPTAGQTAAKKRLQPPPTTRQPAPTRTSQSAESARGAQSGPEEAARDTIASEPKMDLMDMMPIQRINPSASQPVRAPEQPKGGEQKLEQPDNEMKSANETRARGESNPQEQEQFMFEVEPGMRLRPATPQQQAANSNSQANTVYMIMMNMSSPSKSHSKKPSPPESAQSQQQRTSLPKSNPSSTTEPQRQQQQTAATTSSPARAADRGTTSQSSQRPVQQVAASSTAQPPVGSSNAISTNSPQPTTVSPPSTTTTTRARLLESGADMEPQRSPEERPSSTESPVQTKATSSPDQAPARQVSVASTSSPFSRRPSSARPTTLAPSSDSGSPSSTTTQTTPQSVSQQQQASSPRPTAESSTTTGRQTQTSVAPRANQQVDSSTESSNNNNNRDRFERLQQQQQQPKQQPSGERRQQSATKTLASGNKGAAKASNLTSSFIPSKLRTDFNKLSRLQSSDKLQSPSANASRADTPTTQAPAVMAATGPPMSMAIRQFGGANRMSALANQPVAFGRPAAMSMQSAGNRAFNNNNNNGASRNIELPSFEYGPSIAVRRPDEPLANGQVPNCTLTGKNFCVLTKDYPMNEVRQAVERSFRSVRIMYEELQTVSDQELHKDDFNATNNQAASGKFACQTQVEMMRPGWAKDEITKEWMLVVNTDVFPQRVRTESCAQPNTPCEFIAPFYDSTCQQRYSLHRMIAIDPHDPSRSPQVAVFKFPAGCVCRVHPIRKTTTTMIQTTTSATSPAPSTVISSSTSKSIRRR